MTVKIDHRCALRIAAAGILALNIGVAFACEESVSVNAAEKLGGGSAGALQRAGLAAMGTAEASADWRRVPVLAVAVRPVAAATLDARALRGGVRPSAAIVASENGLSSDAD